MSGFDRFDPLSDYVTPFADPDFPSGRDFSRGTATPPTPDLEGATLLRQQLEAELRAEAVAEGLGRVKGHNFWTRPLNNYDPKTQFRFTVEVPGLALEDKRKRKVDADGNVSFENDGGDDFADEKDQSGDLIWYAKSCDKPGISFVNLTQDMWHSAERKALPKPMASAPNFKEVTMTLVDPIYPNVSRKLARLVRRGGFQEKQAYEIAQNLGGESLSLIDSVEYVKINQLDAFGTTIETWTLVDAYPAEIDWGTLDYSSDSLVEITVKWRFRTFKVFYPDIGNEFEYSYFDDVDFTPETESPTGCSPLLKRLRPNQCKSQ